MKFLGEPMTSCCILSWRCTFSELRKCSFKVTDLGNVYFETETEVIRLSLTLKQASQMWVILLKNDVLLWKTIITRKNPDLKFFSETLAFNCMIVFGYKKTMFQKHFIKKTWTFHMIRHWLRTLHAVNLVLKIHVDISDSIADKLVSSKDGNQLCILTLLVHVGVAHRLN